MNNPSIITASIIIIFAFAFKPSSGLSSEKEKYSLGVFPYNSARETMRIYGPVVQDLGTATNSKITLKTANSFNKFTKKLEQESYDIALIQPFDYLSAIDKYNYVPLARLDARLTTYFAVLETSNIHQLSDLENKVIALPPPRAAISHLAKAELLDAGVSITKKTRIKHQKNHNSCLHELLIHRADSCATELINITTFGRKHKIKFRILKPEKSLPHILYVAHKRIPKLIRDQLQTRIISWKNTKNGQIILKRMAMPGFIKVKRNDYDVMYTLPQHGAIKKNHSNRKGLSLGILPYIPAKKLAKKIAPITQSFSEALNNLPVYFRTASSYNQFHKNIANGIYDIILTQPFDYNVAVKQGYEPVGQISYDVQAAIYINKNSEITLFGDLKEKTVASAPWHAATSRLFNEKVRQSGWWVGKDIFINYKTSHFECFEQLNDKKASACISGPLILASVPSRLSKNVVLLEKTHAAPGILFMIHSRVNKQTSTTLKQTILNWHHNSEGQALLNHSNLKFFTEVDKPRYEAINRRNE